ncbi:7 transmembrane receptor [Ancylostoma ceylanicum]|uniref:7 transmembrane receptor n=1 Tax=Ancylostoma ceylanicum TaxID=53326 RepID=A0A0D6M8X2_9BILA|nr:7 transmembrane receptor [Ancylostoma ceylanicum]
MDVLQENSTSFYRDGIMWRHPLLAALLATFCLLTVAGNCLVVIAVCTKKYLRNPTGYLIISLAIADLIVGLVVMPLNSLFEMTNHEWLLGLTMCDLFHALDILASTSSIWNLCVISLDRYMAGQDPIGYRDKVSKRRILMAICCVWMNKCLFTDSAMYVGFSSLVSFYIPLCLILFAYGKVFVIATRHSRGMRMGIKKVKYRNGKRMQTDSESVMSSEAEPTLRIHIGRARKMSNSLRQSRTTHDSTRLLLKQVSCKSLTERGENALVSARSPLLRSEPNNNAKSCIFRVRAAGVPTFRSSTLSVSSPMKLGIGLAENQIKVRVHQVQREEVSDISSVSSPQTGRRKLNVREKSRQMVKYVHEQRAARTLSIVCFVDKETIFTIVTWAGHLNSMLNPLIYSRFSRDFRRAFKQILTCQREQKVKTAFKTPLSLVFTQLISVTQMWDQSQNTQIE